MAKATGGTCTFCGRSSRDTNLPINGISGYICDDCTRQAYEIVGEQTGGEETSFGLRQKDLSKPEDIRTFSDQYVIGQDDARCYLSVSVYSHYKRLLQKVTADDVKIEKSSIIMASAIGMGKTSLTCTIAKLLHIPFVIMDATVLTEANHVGKDIESILARLLQAVGYDVEVVQRGIVFVDEIDKIVHKSGNPSITRDVSGEGIQQGLLKLLEGPAVNVPPQGRRKHPEQKMIAVDTKDILFVRGGAFDGVEKKIVQRLNTRVAGYSASSDTATVDWNSLPRYITPTDLKSFGLIPGIIGRLPILTYLNPLDHNTLRNILIEPKNSTIKQYVKLFEMDGIKLVFDEEVYEFIVNKAFRFKLGAHGLRSIVEAVMMDAMYSMSSQKVKELHVTLKYAKEKFEKLDVDRLRAA